MFYEEKLIDEKLKCLNCMNRFNVPKLLPCGDTICKTCLEKLINESTNSLTCPLCNQTHQLPANKDFPTEKILLKLLEIKPIDVYRGELYEKSKQLIDYIESNLNEFEQIMSQNIECLINDRIKRLKDQLYTANIGQQQSSIDQSLVTRLNNYEIKCLDHIKMPTFQIKIVEILYKKTNERVKHLKNILFNPQIDQQSLENVYEVTKTIENRIKHVKEFFFGLVFMGQKLSIHSINDINASTNTSSAPRNVQYGLLGRQCIVVDEYAYKDILDTNKLIKANANTNKINYSQICTSTSDKEIKSIWLSLFPNETLVICFDIYDSVLCRRCILIKIMDRNGVLLREHTESSINCSIVAMSSSSNEFMLALQNDLDGQNEKQHQILLSDINLKNFKIKFIDYKPSGIQHTQSHIYLFSSTAPFINVHDWQLEKKHCFGQDTNENMPFYMPSTIQVYIGDEYLYARDEEDNSIKLFDLKTGEFLKRINISLIDCCLLQIDLIGQLIVLNQDSKILYIHDDDGKILFEYDLTYIQTISSFCVGNNGHLLINDSQNKLIYIL